MHLFALLFLNFTPAATAGLAHFSFVQTPLVQSAFVLQDLPTATFVAHAPLLHHLLLQSPLSEQVAPSFLASATRQLAGSQSYLSSACAFLCAEVVPHQPLPLLQ